MSIYNVPHYPNRTDYTTNAASYYDDLARKNELMKHLAMRIWEYDKELAKRFAQWDQNLEDFPEDVKNLLVKWLGDGTLEQIINENIFKDLNDQIKALTNEQINLDLPKAKNLYLFDLELSKQTINQGIAIDEVNQHIYATQAFNLEGDAFQSYYLNRLTMGGKLIDSMLIRYGGHGTSIGVEVENGTAYIWTNIQQVSGSTLQTQWLARFPYQANTEINALSPTVQKFEEYPNRFYFQTPIVDNKNGLIGVRTTSEGQYLQSKIEVRKLSNVKNKIFTPEYTFTFTPEMNAGVLQGMAFDGEKGYISFGSTATSFTLFEVDLKNNKVLKRYTGTDFNLDEVNERFEGQVSEPEGMVLYTDPATKQKTLLHVIVSSVPNRRRNRLYGISSNNGINQFVGLSLENTQQHTLTLNDGKGKPADTTKVNLSAVNETGEYYLAQADTLLFADFPLPNVAGWWLSVSAKDSGGGVIQTLRRNSRFDSTTYKRVVTGEGVATPWEGLPVRPAFENGFSDYYPEDVFQKVQYVKNDNTLQIMGIVKTPAALPLDLPLFVLPVGFRPIVRQVFPVSTSNGIMEVAVESDGEVRLPAYKTDAVNPTYVHLNCTVGLNAIGGN